MIKIVSSLIFSLILFLLVNFPVSAHVLLTSGSIGTTVHIDPEDDPIVGQPSNFYFEFKDKQNRFQPANCECKINITKDGTEIYSQDLFSSSPTSNSLTSPVFQFTFPEKNIYSIKITGAPKTPGAFDPFELNHTIRVSRQSGNSQTSTTSSFEPHFSHYLAVGLAILVFTTILLLDRRSRNKKSTKKSAKIISLILGISLLAPIIYASTHFTQDHLLIGDHHQHPCCFVTSSEVADTNTVNINTSSFTLTNSEMPNQPSNNVSDIISGRSPPTQS